ncbi:MAG: hypothetical protein P1U88_19885 [Thalassobaculaceae bacterium]|nr:hypothetical protein [Thalassobaculaceae bacterium]
MTEIDWSYDEPQRLFTVRYHGLATLDVFLKARDYRKSIGVAYGGLRMLIDARNADLSELTAQDFKTMEERRSEMAGGIAERTAALVGRETDMGIGELWAVYRNRSVPGSTAIFMSEREALAWLFADESADG